MRLMSQADWGNPEVSKYFSLTEKWGNPFMLDSDLVYGLVALREYVNKPIHIHCAYEHRNTGGYHPLGRAADIHISGLHVVDQWLAATRFDVFNGIGIYPNWNNPGIHVDTRPKEKRFNADSRWVCIEPGKYLPLNRDTLWMCF